MATYADDMMVDKKEQLKKIEGTCLPGETTRADITWIEIEKDEIGLPGNARPLGENNI